MAEFQQFFAQMAAGYDSIATSVDYSLPDEILCTVHRHTDSAKGTVLDLGIGTGLSSVRLRDMGFTVIGIDASLPMLRVAAKRIRGAHLLRSRLGKEPIPVRDGSCDVVVSSGLFEFIAVPEALVAEIGRVLRSRGLACLAVTTLERNPQLDCLELGGARIDSRAYHGHGGLTVYYHSGRAMLSLLEQAAFEIVDIREVFSHRSPTSGLDVQSTIYVARSK